MRPLLDRNGVTLQLFAWSSMDVASDGLRIFGKTVYFGRAEAGRAPLKRPKSLLGTSDLDQKRLEPIQ